MSEEQRLPGLLDVYDQMTEEQAREIWGSLPPRIRLVMAKEAPKYAGPWLKSGDGWVRDCVGLTAGYVYPSPDGEWVADEIDDREFASAEEAMAAEDEALRAKGWCLDG